ncbi:MAG: glycosyltransferase family 9 protein [Betaproteobacteria bacterium]
MASRALARPVVLGLALARMGAAGLSMQRRHPPDVPKRILVAHHLLLGDTIMVSPLLAKCRARWPGADIVMTCPVAYAGLYAMRPWGVRALPYDPADASTLSTVLTEGGFDLALLPGDSRLSWLARAAGARWIVAFAGDTPAYKNFPIDELRPYPDTPMAWGDLVAGLVDGPAPAPYRTDDWPGPPAGRFGLPPRPYVVLHVGASSRLKRWPPQRWRQLGKQLADEGYSVALSAGSGEAALLDQVDHRGRWMRFSGTLSLPELWHLLAGAELVVCPDTGIAHLARLTGVPTVALFGPGSALLSGPGEFWRKSPFTAMTIPDFPCRDQTVTMKRDVAWVRRCERFFGDAPGECPEARCMLALTDDMVWDAALARLGSASE